MYQRVGNSAYKKDLDNTIALAHHLGNPENNFKTIHVAGTNGKGSVSHMLASVLQEAGYKTGLYTSPHLKDFRERIKIDGKMIPELEVTDFVNRNKPFFETHSLSFFEMTVGLAFAYFSNEKVDIAIIEVGMGGRLDSTNIITPLLSVITNIGKDHTAFLGNSLAEIAAEKAGIIKNGVPIIIGEGHVETREVFKSIAAERNSPIIFAESLKFNDYTSDLKGNYQVKNRKTVLAALEVLKNQNIFHIPETVIQKGLANVQSNTGLNGRWQVLSTEPKVICDTAHNAEGLGYVLEQLMEEQFKTLHMVIGFVSDKDISPVLQLFPRNATYYFCKPDIPRGMEVPQLVENARLAGLTGEGYTSVNEAYKAAMEKASKNDLIFVGGSTFVVAEII